MNIIVRLKNKLKIRDILFGSASIRPFIRSIEPKFVDDKPTYRLFHIPGNAFPIPIPTELLSKEPNHNV